MSVNQHCREYCTSCLALCGELMLNGWTGEIRRRKRRREVSHNIKVKMWANILDKNKNNAQRWWYLSSSTSQIKAFYFSIVACWARPDMDHLHKGMSWTSSRAPNRKRLPRVIFLLYGTNIWELFREDEVSLHSGGVTFSSSTWNLRTKVTSLFLQTNFTSDLIWFHRFKMF